MTGSGRGICPAPLTAEAFAPFGDVIGVRGRPVTINDGRFERFDALALPDIDGRCGISVARCVLATSLPFECRLLERHPLGSQAFVPLSPCRFLIVTAPPGRVPASDDLRAFFTDGLQGVNYRRGTWHMPLVAFETGQRFLVVDRCDEGENCETHRLSRPVLIDELPTAAPRS